MSYIRQLLVRQALRHKTNRPSGLIGQYKPYLNSNDSPTRDILKDYSGQGHDIQLYNFGYALQSGYGSWAQDFSLFTVNGQVEAQVSIVNKTYNKIRIEIKGEFTNSFIAYLPKTSYNYNSSYKIRCVSDLTNLNLSFYTDVSVVRVPLTYNGEIVEVPAKPDLTNANVYIEVPGRPDNGYIELELLPDYPGALVSDGVDDYGSCETPFGEVGTVIVMLDEVNWVNNTFLYNAGSGENRIYCWKSGDIIANGEPFTKNTQQGKFNIFARTPNAINDKFYFLGAGRGNTYSSVAVYSMELYSKKLTDEEIQSVKEAMISEYEKETGNVLEGV